MCIHKTRSMGTCLHSLRVSASFCGILKLKLRWGYAYIKYIYLKKNPNALSYYFFNPKKKEERRTC